jgi:hypothetical protein
MNLHPFDAVVANATSKIEQGWDVYQQWNCTHCGVKQTMPDKNKFFLSGRCEECGKITNIKKRGMNFMAVFSRGPKAEEDMKDILNKMGKGKGVK